MEDIPATPETRIAALMEDIPATPETRIAALMEDMGALKPQLLAILDCCREERTSEEIDAALAPLRELRQSVYTTVNLRSLLEKAGALRYLSRDEEPDEVVDEDGNLVVPQVPAGTWLSTDAGIAYCEAQDPFADLVHALEDEGAYADVYELVLALCAEQPRPVAHIERAVNESGLIAGDKRQPGYFVGKLEDMGALEWRHAWVTTDLGRQYLTLATE